MRHDATCGRFTARQYTCATIVAKGRAEHRFRLPRQSRKNAARHCTTTRTSPACRTTGWRTAEQRMLAGSFVCRRHACHPLQHNTPVPAPTPAHLPVCSRLTSYRNGEHSFLIGWLTDSALFADFNKRLYGILWRSNTVAATATASSPAAQHAFTATHLRATYLNATTVPDCMGILCQLYSCLPVVPAGKRPTLTGYFAHWLENTIWLRLHVLPYGTCVSRLPTLPPLPEHRRLATVFLPLPWRCCIFLLLTPIT